MKRSAFLFTILLNLVCFHGAYPQQVIHLWENGAPGFEKLKNEPEQAKDWWVKNIHNPSITVFLPPPDIANGTAVIICPGGGHRELVFDAEGKDAALFFTKIGVTAFVLKYRLAREPSSPYQLEVHARQDAYRAMRLVRSKAKAWNLDPHRIGMMGFSAGGEVVEFVAYDKGNGDPSAADPVDRENGKPDFQILIYPGPLGVPDKVPSDAPPAFMLAANDDVCCAGPIVNLLSKYREASVPIEVHLYAAGNHAFNMGQRSELTSIRTWPARLEDWMRDNNFFRKK